MQKTETEDAHGAGTPRHRSAWNHLLWIPIVLPLLTFVFNHDGPRVFGFPFFYWFQLLCAVLSMVTIALVRRLTGRDR
ncbi:DUF3311 domain-containing protein [Streptomyces glaucus]|uniref:DUF3311 domain-containing protein n=1 Tax=Streptomyces glaucus TaxID=284029 RepID=A0ABN3JPP2_9ACTN